MSKKFSLFLCFFLITLPCLFSSTDQHTSPTIKEIRQMLKDKSGTTNPEVTLDILNASYDPTRELYSEIDIMFVKWWKERTKQDIMINLSNSGSGKQARSISQGLQADVATLALAFDINAIVKHTGWIARDWESRLPNKSVPFTSTIVFLVREGNPKKIKDWGDLVRNDVKIILPNPKTSGGARWIYLAAWGYAIDKYHGDEAKAIEFMTALFKNVPTLDAGARAASTTFAQRRIGDVLLTWENEAHLVMNELGTEKFDIVIPSISIEAKTPVTWVDEVVKKKGTADVAKFYLAFLYSVEAQIVGMKHYFRPVDPEIVARYTGLFPYVYMFDIDRDFGGWEKVNDKHFKDDALFDKIYHGSL